MAVQRAFSDPKKLYVALYSFSAPPVGAIYGNDAIKHGPLICGPEWAAEINSEFRQSAGRRVYIYAIVETIWTVDLGRAVDGCDAVGISLSGKPKEAGLYVYCDAICDKAGLMLKMEKCKLLTLNPIFVKK